MSDERFNLRDSEDYKELAERVGIDEDAYPESSFRKDIRNYHILVFKKNPKKDGLMTMQLGRITFLDWSYSGEPIEPGDHVLCTVKEDFDHNVATPVMKITPSVLMSFSNEIRDAIVKALWDKNKKDYEGHFEKIYKSEVYEQAKDDAEKANEAKLQELNEEIEKLKTQLSAARYAMSQASFDIDSGRVESDEIELSSEPPKEKSTDRPKDTVSFLSSNRDSERPRRYDAPDRREEVFRYRMWSDSIMPLHYGMPEVKRIAPRALFSEDFDDGRYFVHVSPNKKTMLIRKHEEGEIFCVNHQIMIQDLERLYPFSEMKELKAEISSKYGGILVHLDI